MVSRRSFTQLSLGLSAGVFINTLGACSSQQDSQTAQAATPTGPHPGRHIIYSYPGLRPPQELQEKIANREVGGVIFFAENISSVDQLHSVSRSLHEAAPADLPLLLFTDEEGGLVSRIPGGGPAAKTVDSIRAVRQQADLHASALTRAGLNANLAPVLGVYRHKDDFLDATRRSYSNNPKVVAQLTSAYIQRLQSHKIYATAKHFPGLGSASHSANTDETAVSITATSSELFSVDIAPYKSAISAGVRFIMPSWAVYPALDPHDVAGMSTKIITEVLRTQLGFSGLTVTDAIEAGALARYGNTSQRAVKAINAGNDLLCCSNRSIDQGDAAAAAIQEGLQSGEINAGTYRRSQSRLAAFRRL